MVEQIDMGKLEFQNIFRIADKRSLFHVQFALIIVGFIASGVFLNTSFNDWTSEPIITTMDSIAAPINDIQFPTVTVCQNGHRQPDRWAYLETVLNFVKL